MSEPVLVVRESTAEWYLLAILMSGAGPEQQIGCESYTTGIGSCFREDEDTRLIWDEGYEDRRACACCIAWKGLGSPLRIAPVAPWTPSIDPKGTYPYGR